jgi:hypothetical protein
LPRPFFTEWAFKQGLFHSEQRIEALVRQSFQFMTSGLAARQNLERDDQSSASAFPPLN